jgi:hypothetical protein
MRSFWFTMQIAMIAGFFTALPVNAWLIRKGWKEKMPKVDPTKMEGEMIKSRPGERRSSAA